MGVSNPYSRNRINKVFKEHPPETDGIDELDLTVQLIARLRRNGIKTIADLRKQSDWDLLDIQYVGTKTILSIDKALQKAGYPIVTREQPKINYDRFG